MPVYRGAAAGPQPVDELDEMIVRTEAACVRYRHAADAPGLSSVATRMRRDRWQAM